GAADPAAGCPQNRSICQPRPRDRVKSFAAGCSNVPNMKLESFWTAPPPPFEGCTDRLADKADVVVVGGGFTGLSAARSLALRGAHVVVLEAGAVPAAGAGPDAGGGENVLGGGGR